MSSDSSYFNSLGGTDPLELESAPLDEYDEDGFSVSSYFRRLLASDLVGIDRFGCTDPSEPENAPLDVYDEEESLRYFGLVLGGLGVIDRFEYYGRTNLNEYDEEFSVCKDIESHMKKIVVLDDGEVCSVCLQDINVGDENTRVLKCSHIFHHRCMSEWSKRKPNCPLCRHDVRTDRQPNLKRKRLLHEAQELKDETSSTHCQRKT
ncbi:hypothetical protein MKW98_019664 [Papaver atlanticum]|uniref:RING-type domain-containing protein n=1 Tax=Papaver atlanticum TaxID=357466 RepID=A0AAD4XA97_9MAGN|nr:hypothetical protein MKW98_019664 [Papaver atlanticum]